MVEVNQIHNLLLAQAPPNVRAQAEAGEDAVQRAAAPTAPYTSRAAGLLKALQGGLGGLMESSAIQQAMRGRQDAATAGYGWLNGLQTGGGGAGAVGGSVSPVAAALAAPPQSGQGGIGSDYVAGKQSASHAAWIASIMPEAQRISAQTGVDARIIAAQAAHESNYGRSAPGGNLFGIKGAGTGPISTTESINGVMTPTKASFATYDSPSAAFDGYGKLMMGSRYAGVRTGQGLDAQLAALGKSGYATDPNYAAKVGNIARSISLPGPNSGPGAPATTAASPVTSGSTIGDTAALAAQNRLSSGQGTAADRALLTAYKAQQNTPPATQTATAAPASDGTVRGDLMAAAAQHGGLNPDAPAPGATPTGMQGLPSGVTPEMWAASQNKGGSSDGNALRRGDETPAGLSGPVTASGVPHQLAVGAPARADSGVGVGIGGGPSNTARPAPSATATPELDPEGTGPQNYDPNAGPSLRDMIAAQVNGPASGVTQPAVMPAPAPLGASDKVLPGGLVQQPAAPPTLPVPLGRPTGPGAQPAPVPDPTPLASGDTVGAGGIVTPPPPAPPAPPPSDGSLRGDIMSAMAQGGAQVPDPIGSFGDLPTPAEDTVGPQTDAAMGNAVPGQGPMGAPPAAMQAALPDAGPVPPPGAQSLQAPADAASASAAAAAPSLDPEAVGLPAAEPSLRGQIASQVLGGSPTPAPAAPGSAAPPLPAPGSVDDFGRTTAQAMGGAAPAVSNPAPGSAPLPMMAQAGAPGPTPMGGSGAPGPANPPAPGSGAALPAVGPMPPPGGQTAGAGSSLPQTGPMPPPGVQSLAAMNPDAPAPNAVPAGPQPMPPSPGTSPLAAALGGPSFGGSGTNAPAGNSPMSDPSSAQNFMRAEAARAQGGSSPTPGSFMAGIAGAGTPARGQGAPGSGMLGAGGPWLGGPAQPPSATPAPSAPGQPYQQGTPDQARAIAQSTQANPSAPPASQAVAGQVMAATGGQGGAPSSAAATPAPTGAPAAGGYGGMTPEQRQAGIALLTGPNAAYLPQELREAISAKLYPQPMKLAQGEGLVGLRPDGTYGELFSQPSKDQFVYAPDGVHVLNKATGRVTLADGDGSGGAGGWRPMTPAEQQRYGVTDGRPAYIAPNGEPHFGMPGTQGQGETEEAKESGKAAAGRQNDMLNAANAAPEKLARLQLMRTVLHNTATGPLAGEAGTVSSIATRLGIAPERLTSLGLDPNQAVNNAIASKLANEMTMGSIGAKNGGMPASNFSVAERQFIETLYPSIENQAGGNEALLDVLSATEQKKQQWGDAWSDYKDQQRAAGKALSYGDFEDSFRRAHANENIFAPVMAKYQAGGYTPTAPNPGGVPSAAPAGGGQGGAPSIAQQPAASAPQPQGQGGGYLPGAARGAPPPAQGSGQAPRNVAPGVTGGPPQPQAGQGADPLSQARAAIAAGAPRAAVMQRLQGMGINAAGL